MAKQSHLKPRTPEQVLKRINTSLHAENVSVSVNLNRWFMFTHLQLLGQ